MSAEHRSLALSGALDIYAALEVRQRLLAAFEGAADLEVDLSGVEEIDTAGIQLLAAVKAQGARLGVEVRFAGHSEAVLAALDAYHLSARFGDPVLMKRGGAA